MITAADKFRSILKNLFPNEYTMLIDAASNIFQHRSIGDFLETFADDSAQRDVRVTYMEILKREPDVLGKYIWGTYITKGMMTKEKLRDRLKNSKEYKERINRGEI